MRQDLILTGNYIYSDYVDTVIVESIDPWLPLQTNGFVVPDEEKLILTGNYIYSDFKGINQVGYITYPLLSTPAVQATFMPILLAFMIKRSRKRLRMLNL